MGSVMRVGLIGNGGIARACRDSLAAELIEFTTLARSEPDQGQHSGRYVGSLDELLASRPDVVVECAGHGAVRDHAQAVLKSGIPIFIVSIGALADSELHRTLREMAELSGASLMLIPGAIGGLDALEAARIGGLDSVRYRASKPTRAWRGTTAETMVDLKRIDRPTTFYTGTAREAALTFPQNSNVAAAIALAGIGFEETIVELIADPLSARNVHEIAFEGRDGRCRIEIEGNPSPDNPKTSMLTAHSVARALLGFRQRGGCQS